MDVDATDLANGTLAIEPGNALLLDRGHVDKLVIEHPAGDQARPSTGLWIRPGIPPDWELTVSLTGLAPHEALALGSVSLIVENVTGRSLVTLSLSDEALWIATYGDACSVALDPTKAPGVASLEQGTTATVTFTGGPDRACPTGTVEIRYDAPVLRPNPWPAPRDCPGQAHDCSTEVLFYALTPGEGGTVDVRLPVPASDAVTIEAWHANATVAPSGEVTIEQTERGDVLRVRSKQPVTVASYVHQQAKGDGSYAEDYLDAQWTTMTGDGDGRNLTVSTEAPLSHLSLYYRASSTWCGRSNGGHQLTPTGTGWIHVPGAFSEGGECA